NLPDDLPDLGVIKPSDRLAIEQGGRRAGAKAKAIDRLERHRTVVRRFMEVDAEQLLKRVRHLVRAHGLTGFGLAKPQDMPAGRVLAKVGIEGNDARDLGASEELGRASVRAWRRCHGSG